MKKILIFILMSFIFIGSANAETIEEQLNSLKDNFNSLKSEVNNLETNRLDKTYPVGSVYITTTYATTEQVANALGGTWEVYGSGKTIVGVDSNDDNFNTVNKTGGSSLTTLAAGNLPSHTHSIPALSGTAASAGSHTHTRGTMDITGAINVRALSSSNGAVTWAGGSFSTTLLEWTGSHGILGSTLISPAYYSQVSFNAANNWSGSTSSNGAHTHNVTTTANTSGSTGSGTSFTNLQPYITVYMYKRVS